MNGKRKIVLSHGLESGPQATKVTAMAAVARELGWEEVRPDYRDLDATRIPANLDKRVERLLEQVSGEGEFIFAGSSMGAFISGLASLRVPCRGLFLLAPPLRIPGYATAFDLAPVPTEIVHGWDDELIPADEVIAFARARRLKLHLVNDSHRLTEHVELTAQWFRLFLEGLK